MTWMRRYVLLYYKLMHIIFTSWSCKHFLNYVVPPVGLRMLNCIISCEVHMCHLLI